MENSRESGLFPPTDESKWLEGHTSQLVRSGSSPRPSPTQSATYLVWPSSPRPVDARSISSVSLQSSNGSGYLTPPLQAFHDTAPYKPAEDDLISLNMRNGRKRKRKTKYWAFNCGATKQSSESSTSSFDEVRDVQDECFLARHSERKSSQSSLPAASEHQRAKHGWYPRSSNPSASPPHTAFVQQGSWQTRHIPTTVFHSGQTESSKKNTSDISKRVHNNLARVSQALAARKHPRWSFVESGVSPIQTYSTAIATRNYKPKIEREHFSGLFSDGHGFSKQHGISVPPQRSLRIRYPGHQRPDVKSKRLHLKHAETPATITLRKASGITIFQEDSDAIERGLRQADMIHPVPEQGLRRGMTRISRMVQQLPSHSDLAEASITYTDVHVAPSMMTRTLSGEVVESSVSRLRRTSAAQSRVRSSVHEVLWKDECSSSSPSSASQESPRLSVQLTRTQSDPSERSYFTDRSSGSQWDLQGKRGSNRTRSGPNISFIGVESSLKAQTRVVKSPLVSQKLSEWTWNHDSKSNDRYGEAMLFIRSKRSRPAVQDEGKPAVDPLSEHQGDGLEGFSDDEPCVQPSRCTFDSEARGQHDWYTRQSIDATTDHFTDVLTECTTARTGPPPTLSTPQESQRRTCVKGSRD